MTTPIAAPPIMPARVTVFARYPSHATTAFTASAHGSVVRSHGVAASIDCADIRLPSHNTPAAVAGTDTLSSSRAGIVSTKAATTAAATGAAMTNDSGGIGVIAGRVHQASATPAIAPQMMKPIVPAIVFSRFHG